MKGRPFAFNSLHFAEALVVEVLGSYGLTSQSLNTMFYAASHDALQGFAGCPEREMHRNKHPASAKLRKDNLAKTSSTSKEIVFALPKNCIFFERKFLSRVPYHHLQAMSCLR